jgi:hypothetical protein
MMDCSNSASAKGGTPGSEEPSWSTRNMNNRRRYAASDVRQSATGWNFKSPRGCLPVNAVHLLTRGVPVDLQHEVL